ncbi:MAG: hypothetical protein WB709_08615, partial [Solirubrobacteraceae bacterium]
ECESQPGRALERARSWAEESGERRAVLATGSIYLVGDLMRGLSASDTLDRQSASQTRAI